MRLLVLNNSFLLSCACDVCVVVTCFFFFFKQKTAYEMRISDWSSDVCSSDLGGPGARNGAGPEQRQRAGDSPGDQRRGLPGELIAHAAEIGRASCRERVCQYV